MVTMLAAFGAGSICTLVTNPMSVIRSRMLLSDPEKTRKYTSISSTLKHIIKCEGFGGFYKVQRLLVMGCDQNLREMSLNVNSRFTFFGNRELHECQFSLFFVIFSEKLANSCMISREINTITGVGHELEFTF